MVVPATPGSVRGEVPTRRRAVSGWNHLSGGSALKRSAPGKIRSWPLKRPGSRARNRHVTKTGRRRRSSIDGRTTRHAGYALSQRRRKLVEEAGWIKTVAGQGKTRSEGSNGSGWSFVPAPRPTT